MRTFRAGNLEVMREDLNYPDFPLKMSYEEIENLELGKYSEEGWRIPTYSEIKYLYNIVNCAAYNRLEWNSQKWCIGKFGDECYWATSLYDVDSFILFDFLGGSIEPFSKGRLRLVRNIE
jgi:hypothetical protein